MIKIDLIKKTPGTPEEKLITKEIIDENIINYPYAIRISSYILDSKGRKWWVASGSTAATELLSRGDIVEFWADGTRYSGFLPVSPALDYSISQGSVSMIWNITVWFLK